VIEVSVAWSLGAFDKVRQQYTETVDCTFGLRQ